MVQCRKCHEMKDSSEYYTNKTTGYIDKVCKECISKQNKVQYLEHKTHFNEKGHSKILHKKQSVLQKTCTKCNIEKNIQEFTYDKVRDYYFSTCKECGRIYALSHKPKRNYYYDSLPETTKMRWQVKKELFLLNKRQCKECGEVLSLTSYRILHKPPTTLGHYSTTCEKCIYQRHKTNLQWKLATNLSTSLNNALIGRKGQKTFVYLGCSISELQKWLESQFTEGMSWDNRGINGWHIDHYVPISYFDMSQEEDRFICWNYRNLRPLWGIENLKKGKTLPNDYLQHIERIKKDLKKDFSI